MVFFLSQRKGYSFCIENHGGRLSRFNTRQEDTATMTTITSTINCLFSFRCHAFSIIFFLFCLEKIQLELCARSFPCFFALFLDCISYRIYCLCECCASVKRKTNLWLSSAKDRLPWWCQQFAYSKDFDDDFFFRCISRGLLWIVFIFSITHSLVLSFSFIIIIIIFVTSFFLSNDTYSRHAKTSSWNAAPLKYTNDQRVEVKISYEDTANQRIFLGFFQCLYFCHFSPKYEKRN